MTRFVNMAKEDIGALDRGFVRNKGEGRGVRVTHAKVTELPHPDPLTVQDAALALAGTNQYPNIKTPLKARQTKLACMGIPSHILDKGSPVYARCVRLANAYKKARTKELFQAHGYVSSGVGALLASASLALSASRYLYEIASTADIAPEERGAIGLPQLLKLASSLSDSSRQSELSAWELCAREAVIRKRNDMNNVALPWLTGQSGGEQKKPGRPRLAEAVESQMENPHA